MTRQDEHYFSNSDFYHQGICRFEGVRKRGT